MKNYYVYIVTNNAGTVLYTGVTNDLRKRMAEHVAGLGCEFTRKYKCQRLLYFETYGEIIQAIAREKEIKGWRRSKKEALIRTTNARWVDAKGQL